MEQEPTAAEQLLQLIKKGYINRNNQFQSTKFRIDHPKEYNRLFYHFQTNEKGTTMQKIIKKLGCAGRSRELIDVNSEESKGIAKLFLYCDLKKLLEQGSAISQIAGHLHVSRQYLHREYKKLEKRFSI